MWQAVQTRSRLCLPGHHCCQCAECSLQCGCGLELETKVIRRYVKISQWWIWLLLVGPSQGWKRLLALSHLRHYATQVFRPRIIWSGLRIWRLNFLSIMFKLGCCGSKIYVADTALIIIKTLCLNLHLQLLHLLQTKFNQPRAKHLYPRV